MEGLVLLLVVIGVNIVVHRLITTYPAQEDPDNNMNQFRAVFVTVPNMEVAKKIASGLVSHKLAACVNIIPHVTSVYEWEGKINEDSELILMIKSQESLFSELEKFVKENHPYSVPEVIGLPIQQGSQSYLDWIAQVTAKKSSE